MLILAALFTVQIDYYTLPVPHDAKLTLDILGDTSGGKCQRSAESFSTVLQEADLSPSSREVP